MNDSVSVKPVGDLEITVTFRLRVTDLAHYEADSLQDAAENLNEWYEDGSSDLIADMGCTNSIDVQVRVVGETQ